MRAVWSSEMPLAGAYAVLNLLDGPVGIDPAFHIICARFRMMRMYLAYCPEEEPGIFRMLDLVSWGTRGHGLVHLLFTSAAELGSPGMVKRKVGFGFLSFLLDAWRYSFFFLLN